MSTHLINQPRDQWGASIANAVAALFKTVFPNRIRSIYVIGSRATQAATRISDIDGCILFKDTFINASEKRLATNVLHQCQQMSPIRLDFMLFAEADERFKSSADVRLKLGGQLIYGEDIREQLPLPTLEAYQAYMREWVSRFLSLLHDVDSLQYPLTFPDPHDQYQGYTRKRVAIWYPPDMQAGTKEFVATVCWVATGLLAIEAEQYVPTREACLELAQEHLAPQTADFVTRVYQQCKVDWEYRVPAEEHGQAQLRQLCEEALSFFNEALLRFLS